MAEAAVIRRLRDAAGDLSNGRLALHESGRRQQRMRTGWKLALLIVNTRRRNTPPSLIRRFIGNGHKQTGVFRLDEEAKIKPNCDPQGHFVERVITPLLTLTPPPGDYSSPAGLSSKARRLVALLRHQTAARGSSCSTRRGRIAGKKQEKRSRFVPAEEEVPRSSRCACSSRHTQVRTCSHTGSGAKPQPKPKYKGLI